MFKIDAELIYIIFVTIACWVWAYMIGGELFDKFLRYAEKKNKEKKGKTMQIVIDIPEEKINEDKTIEDMVREMAERGWVSSSALYLMSRRCK